MGEVRRSEESLGATLPPSSERADGATAPGIPAAEQGVLQLYEQHIAAIYRFIYTKVGNREEAEDLTSQVFVKALRRLDSSRDPQSVQGWLFQVARTTVADHWREFYRLRTDSLDDLLSGGWEAAADGATPPSARVNERVERILTRLPKRYREVLTYRFLRSYSIKETAERMSISEANVKVLQFRALRRAAREGPDAL